MTTSHDAVNTAEPIITDDGRVLNDPTHAKPIGHGNSSASWALVFLELAGVLIGGIGMLTAVMPVIIVGVSLMVLGVLVGFVMRQMGYGVGGSKTRSH